jgi:aminocarboxymuconate-semialdehyde decarboxylase
MAEDDVDVEVLSAPPVYSWLDGNTARFCEQLNDFHAGLAREHSSRFRCFVHLPVHEPEAARRELQRWRAKPEVAGVLFGSSMGGVYPGHPMFLPVWEAIHDMGLPVFIHPTGPSSCFGPAVHPVVLFPMDTTLAAASIVYAGIFDRFPDIKIILAHYGGALPFLASRLDMAIDIPGFPAGHGQDLRRKPAEYVERFYVDTAQGFHRAAFECARSVLGIDHLLYGSDHFFIGSTWRARLNRFFADAGLPESDLRAILYANARRILPCFRETIS